MGNGHDDELIVRLYDCATNPELWREVLEEFTARVGADASVLFTEDFNPTSTPFHQVARFDPAEVEAVFFGRHRDNPWSRASLKRPMGQVARTEETVPLRELVESEFYTDCLEPFGLLHSLGANLFFDEGIYAGFTFLRGRKPGSFSDDVLEDMRRFVPHFRGALRVALRLAAADMQRAVALDALDRIDTATLLLDGRGRVLFANRVAEQLLGEHPDLWIDAERDLRTAHDDASLQKVIGAAIRGIAGATIELDTRMPIDASVSPLGAHQTHVAGTAPRAVVFLRPLRPPQPNHRELADRFGLTEAESRVAALLVDGSGLPRVAEELGVSVNTVRTHVAHIFAKTGTHRQAELVNLILSTL